MTDPQVFKDKTDIISVIGNVLNFNENIEAISISNHEVNGAEVSTVTIILNTHLEVEE